MEIIGCSWKKKRGQTHRSGLPRIDPALADTEDFFGDL
jgi:hypothetical protein